VGFSTPNRVTNGNRVISGNRVTGSDPRRLSNRGDLRFGHPPNEISRDWDHAHFHNWNNHRWHWRNGNWVIFDASPYYYSDYGYDYAPDNYDYGAGSYDYGTESTPSGYAQQPYSTVSDVQSRLAQEGYYSGVIDGMIGPETRQAVSAYQHDHNLPVTGGISADVLNQLGLQ
jgi:hypothetical protein